MKRFTAMLLALCLPLSACAEIVGITPDGDYIHRMEAKNGQSLYFTGMDEEPSLQYADVNFDGAEDAAVLTTRGASNFVYQLFLWDGTQYVNSGLAVVNYTLHPEQKLLESDANDGWAVRTRKLYRFEDGKPVLTRIASCEEKTKVTFTADGWEQYTSNTTVTFSVEVVEDGNTKRIWEQDVALADETAYNEAEKTQQQLLWQGL